jgi:hypothetical protein
MTDVGRMSVGELVGKVMADEHADVLRQAVCWLAQELMEAEVSERAGAGYGQRRPDRVTRRNGLPGASLGHPGRLDRAGHPQAAARLILPELANKARLALDGPPSGRAGSHRCPVRAIVVLAGRATRVPFTAMVQGRPRPADPRRAASFWQPTAVKKRR